MRAYCSYIFLVVCSLKSCGTEILIFGAVVFFVGTVFGGYFGFEGGGSPRFDTGAFIVREQQHDLAAQWSRDVFGEFPALGERVEHATVGSVFVPLGKRIPVVG